MIRIRGHGLQSHPLETECSTTPPIRATTATAPLTTSHVPTSINLKLLKYTKMNSQDHLIIGPLSKHLIRGRSQKTPIPNQMI